MIPAFEKVKKNLEANGFKVSEFESGKDAVEYLDREIDGKTVGIGGSMTIKELGLAELLAAHNTLISHWSAEDRAAALKAAQSSDVYLSSVNGLSEDGEIINIDGSCNRVSGTLFGHKKVYFIVGKNKLAPDYDAALFRARNIAAPLNAKRLKRKTPCAEKGDRCYNCNSPERICRALTVFWQAPGGAEYEVVLVNENLGY